MTSSAGNDGEWTPWIVAPDSGFEVDNSDGRVGLIQIDRKQFTVTDRFRFGDDALQERLVARLVRNGRDPAEAQAAVDAAREFAPGDPTDLASVPLFMRWFENPYGRHTLAAIIHDVLIVDEPNGGALGSDTVADTLFREMMKSAGVPWLKRWIMWCAVALRTRWAAGGKRRLSLIAWLVLAIVGIASFVSAMGAWVFGWGSLIDPVWLLLIGLGLPFASARLWGNQWGASLVAAVAAFWIIPAAAFALLGFVVYVLLEWVAGLAGFD